MQQLSDHSIQSSESNLVKAVLYPFAMCDYEGQTGITLKSISCSDVFEGLHIDVVNRALEVCQRAELIEWDEDRIGGIRLTQAGLARLMQVRDEFFDADALLLLNKRLEETEVVQQVEPVANAIVRAKAGDPCPKPGVWQPFEASAREVTYRAGEIMQDLRSPYGFTVWTWVRD